MVHPQDPSWQNETLPEGHVRFLARLPEGYLRSLIYWLGSRATRFVAIRRDRFLFRVLAAVALRYLDMLANVCYEIELNGELRVLRMFSTVRPQCVFDVGANVGDWSIAAATLFGEAEIHSFEIVPKIAELLSERLTKSGVASIHVNPFGLADENSTVKVAYLPNHSALSSAVVAQPVEAPEWQECQVRRGDDYCRERGIEHIDFLKLDVEGLERQVLAGFHEMLSGGKVDIVQFEYGHVNAHVRFLLGDLYDLLGGYGYSVGKIYPTNISFRAYDPWRDEDWRGPNYLAVRRERFDLIHSLQGNA